MICKRGTKNMSSNSASTWPLLLITIGKRLLLFLSQPLFYVTDMDFKLMLSINIA